MIENKERNRVKAKKEKRQTTTISTVWKGSHDLELRYRSWFTVDRISKTEGESADWESMRRRRKESVQEPSALSDARRKVEKRWFDYTCTVRPPSPRKTNFVWSCLFPPEWKRSLIFYTF